MVEIKLTVNEQDMRNIMAGLGELPFKVSYQTIIKLEKQSAEQMKNKENG